MNAFHLSAIGRNTHRKFWAIAVSLAIVLATGWHFKRSVHGCLILLEDWYCGVGFGPESFTPHPVSQRWIAHAGGAVGGESYTNSLDALDQHYSAGYRVFELDFNWTTDGRLVLVHDWNHTSKLFNVPQHVFSYEEFKSGHRKDGLHQLTFEQLFCWMKNHRDAYIVTDTKNNNMRLLQFLRENSMSIHGQWIVQIYCMQELNAARQLEPRAVWLTAYRYSYPAWAMKRVHGVDALVFPIESYNEYQSVTLRSDVPTYVHSVDAGTASESMRNLPGVYGAYVN